MRSDFHSDDYAIACCVSPMVIGKQMQFFGARANLAKTLLYAINGGVDEKLKIQVGPKTAPLRDEVLDYGTVMASLDHFMDWLAVQYISALNIIHCMHDKYSYEAALMALHDRDVYRTMACGIARPVGGSGFVVGDKVRPGEAGARSPRAGGGLCH